MSPAFPHGHLPTASILDLSLCSPEPCRDACGDGASPTASLCIAGASKGYSKTCKDFKSLVTTAAAEETNGGGVGTVGKLGMITAAMTPQVSRCVRMSCRPSRRD